MRQPVAPISLADWEADVRLVHSLEWVNRGVVAGGVARFPRTVPGEKKISDFFRFEEGGKQAWRLFLCAVWDEAFVARAESGRPLSSMAESLFLACRCAYGLYLRTAKPIPKFYHLQRMRDYWEVLRRNIEFPATAFRADRAAGSPINPEDRDGWDSHQMAAAYYAVYAFDPNDRQCRYAAEMMTEEGHDAAAELLLDALGMGRRVGPEHMTNNVVSLARSAYHEDPGIGPVLADALEEASFDCRFTLDRLRSGRKLHKGCWILDTILGAR